MFYVIKNNTTVIHQGTTIADCVTFVNSILNTFVQGDIIQIVQVVRTGSVSVTVTIS